MKKTLFLAVAFFIVGIGLQSFTQGSSPVDPVGTWSYKAATAPEGYGAGDIVIAKDKDVFIASLKFGDYVVKGTGVKYEKDVLTFKVFLEGEYISVKATFAGDGIKGTASYSEGDVPFTAIKKATKK
ncbi:MAG: hypothetical protein NTV01_01385 [Bacteroidia bacterium]|nr:hypothetical protein [Bacteroidia bacterium]